jgi:hypothetical protein
LSLLDLLHMLLMSEDLLRTRTTFRPSLLNQPPLHLWVLAWLLRALVEVLVPVPVIAVKTMPILRAASA